MITMRQWFALIGMLLASGLASAQATRTWVSGVGDDANPCSRTAPCRTLAGAISKTAANGIINLLDPAAVGAVTITKSITIQADGTTAGILASGTNGVIVNAGATDIVTLRGLSISGITGGSITGLNGVRILAAGTVYIEDCDVQSFTEGGIAVETTTALKLVVQDTSITNVLTPTAVAAIALLPNGVSVRATLDRVRIQNARAFGVKAVGDVRVVLRDTVVTQGEGTGVSVDTGVALVDNSTISEHSANGVAALAGGVVRLRGSTITGNAQGVLSTAGGQIISFGNNALTGNTVNGSPTSTIAQQ